MTGKGGITQAPKRQLRIVLAAQALWLVMVVLLGAWWTRLLLIQAERISELELVTGLAEKSQTYWERMRWMLMWESGTFYGLLILSSGFLAWLYWRDMKRSRSLQAFFASLTHELRTPLTSIRLQAESIADSLGSDSSQTALIGRLLEDTMRLEAQVERTLELARVEGGGPVFTQSVRIRPWLDRTLKSWLESHSDRLAVTNRVGDTIAQIDVSAVQVILKNLLENSLRHSKRSPIQVELSDEHRDEWVVIRYRDNGEGVQGNPRKLGALFQKCAASQGAGVGLYLVRVLMERMGGRAEFASPGGFEAILYFKEGQSDG